MPNDDADLPAPGTGDQRIIPTGGDGETTATGQVEMVKGYETRPCAMCRSWEKDEKRIVEFFISKGLTLTSDGKFITPIAKDVGRVSQTLDPKKFGFCRKDMIPTEDLATCEGFQPVRTTEELRSRINARR